MIRVSWSQQQEGRVHAAHVPQIPWLGCKVTKLRGFTASPGGTADGTAADRYRVEVLLRGPAAVRLICDIPEPATLEEAQAWFQRLVDGVGGGAQQADAANTRVA
jgi:hypothetical protein